MQIIPMSSIIWSFTPVCCDGSVYDTPRYILPSISRGRAFNRINKTQWPFRQTVLFSFAADISNGRRRRLFRLSGKTARVFDYLSVAKKSKHLVASRTLADVSSPPRRCTIVSRFLENNTRTTKVAIPSFSRIGSNFVFPSTMTSSFWKRDRFFSHPPSSISERETIVQVLVIWGSFALLVSRLFGWMRVIALL